MMFVATIPALLGVGAMAMLLGPGNQPGAQGAYMLAAAGFCWIGVRLYARLRYGRGVKVTFSRRID